MKEPWKMTKEEYAGVSPDVTRITPKYKKWIDKVREKYDLTKRAIEEGKPVPKEVLAEYPELVKKPKLKPVKLAKPEKKVETEVKPITLNEAFNQVGLMSDEADLFLDRKTGRIITLYGGELNEVWNEDSGRTAQQILDVIVQKGLAAKREVTQKVDRKLKKGELKGKRLKATYQGYRYILFENGFDMVDEARNIFHKKRRGS